MIRLRFCALVLLCCWLPALATAANVLDTSHFNDLNSRPASISALRGKVILVNFWATWCAPCRKEMPMLNRLSSEWGRRGIQVVGIALDNKPEVVAFVRQNKIRYPIWLGDDQSMDLLPALGNAAIGLPFTVLLDRQGRQIASWTGQLSEPLLVKALAQYH